MDDDRRHTERELQTTITYDGDVLVFEVRDVQTGLELTVPKREVAQYTDEDLHDQLTGHQTGQGLLGTLTQEVLETYYAVFDPEHEGWPVGMDR